MIGIRRIASHAHRLKEVLCGCPIGGAFESISSFGSNGHAQTRLFEKNPLLCETARYGSSYE
jgi:hypothetical protein